MTFTGDDFNRRSLGSDWRAYDRSNGAETFGHTDPHALHRYDDAAVTLDGDKLVITATKQGSYWRSGFVSSKETGRLLPLFGRIEVNASLPDAPGIWPAIWLRHRDGSSVAEVDIIERFHAGPDDMSSHLHFPRTAGTNVWGKGVRFGSPTGFHTYWAEIAPSGSGIKFTIGHDDTTVGSYVLPGDKDNLVKAGDQQKVWAVALNVAVTNDRYCGNAAQAHSPQVMKVDWVKWRALTTPHPAPAPSQPTVHLSMLKYGNSGPDVKALQEALNRHLHLSIPTTGNYLSQTDTAVRQCQREHGFGNDPVGKSFVGSRQATHLGLRVS
jgi:beta-glucanase (GH16 family)